MMSRRTVGDRLVMSPMEPLVAGGAAETFERHVQQLFRSGYRHLIVDLSGVPVIDSAGIRAFVRGHTSAQRVGGTLRLAAAPAAVSRVLELAHLAGVFEMYRVGRGGADGGLAVEQPSASPSAGAAAVRGARLGRHPVAARAEPASATAADAFLPGTGAGRRRSRARAPVPRAAEAGRGRR